ncbi:MAG: FAD-dependent oxidoreductase [FCB group bacterium]|nr:FAD-dependent oxidoreductase [FCB group bacterium]
MDSGRRVLIIGGVAAGPKTASKVARLDPHAQVTVLDRGSAISFAGCGLPYYVSGTVKELSELMSTAAGVVRDAGFFAKVKNVRVETRTEAVEIDRAGKRVLARRLADGTETWLAYDSLVLATGARPVVPPIPGANRPGVFTMHSLEDAEQVRAAVDAGGVVEAVVVGGGLIGVEMAEALAERGCRVTVVEMQPQILTLLDWEMAKALESHMATCGVKVLTNTAVREIEGEDRVTGVVTSAGRLSADLVILAVGVRPNIGLAKEAGLEIGSTGAIRVDGGMRTSDPDIYAVGDCAETRHLVTGRPCYAPLGSTANKQGRVAAINICGGHDEFPGVLGSAVCRVLGYRAARTGLTEAEARAAGYDIITVLSPGPDRAHFMPKAATLMLKLVVDKVSRKLLGAQAVGPSDGSKRIDVAATAIAAGMSVDDIAKLDLCYAPPFAPAMDNLITAADIARNKLDGTMRGVTPMDVHAMQERGERFVFLDVRGPVEWAEVRLPDSINIPLGALRGRLGELDPKTPIIAFCKVSLRGYEAALILEAAGFENVRVMDGGVVMWPYEKETASATVGMR